ncbi:hypothetical protein M8J77_025014 [Diaphorina citri]|nr:hypothetical protein M8J77_025014 [Diaphorina citri]
MTEVSREHMGAYLCIASNGVPPSVSKRIMLIVQFPPIVKIPSQLIGAHEGQQLVLECISEAYPKSVNYWTREKGDMIANGKFHCHARVTSIIGHGRDQYFGKTFSPDIADILISHG